MYIIAQHGDYGIAASEPLNNTVDGNEIKACRIF